MAFFSYFMYRLGFLFHSVRGFGDRDNFFRVAMQYVRMNKLSGDYLEFGVFNGVSFTSAFYFLIWCVVLFI